MSYSNNNNNNNITTSTTTTTTTTTSTNISTTNESNLPIVKLDFEDIPLLNFDIDDFIKEQDLVLKDQVKNQLFQRLIEPLRKSYQDELNLIDEYFNNAQNETLSLFPTGYYPKEVLEFIESHVKYQQLLCIKTKASLRSKVFDSIQHIFQTHISLATNSIDNNNNSTLNTTEPLVSTTSGSTTSTSSSNQDNNNSKRKKKRKVDVILEKWYSINYTQPYPLYSDKIFLASFSKISKTKVEEWFGNKRTRVRKQVKDGDDHEKKINKNIISTTTHKKKRGVFVY